VTTVHINFPKNEIDIAGDYSPTMSMPDIDRHLYYIKEAYKIATAHDLIPEKVIVSFYRDTEMLHRGCFWYRPCSEKALTEILEQELTLSIKNIGIQKWLEG
jgi:hypothetical protein